MDVRFANEPQHPCEILESLPQPPAQRPKLDSESHCISHHAQPQRSSLEPFPWANSPGERTCANAQPSQNVGPRSASRHSPRREGPRLAGTSSTNKSSCLLSLKRIHLPNFKFPSHSNVVDIQNNHLV